MQDTPPVYLPRDDGMGWSDGRLLLLSAAVSVSFFLIYQRERTAKLTFSSQTREYRRYVLHLKVSEISPSFRKTTLPIVHILTCHLRVSYPSLHTVSRSTLGLPVHAEDGTPRRFRQIKTPTDATDTPRQVARQIHGSIC